MAAAENATAARPVDEVLMVDMDQLLEEHRRRQMLEHLTGPMISVLLHMVVLTIAFFFLVSPEQIEVPEFEVTITEVKVKQLEQKVVEQKQVIENKIDPQVPRVDKPDITTDGADGDGGDGGDGGTGGGATGDFSDGPPSNDTGVDAFSVLEMRADRTPLKMSALYGGRTNAGRKGSGGRLGKLGMTAVTESAVLKGLRWLKDHQNPDGSWSQSQPVGMSGLAILAFLAHGEIPDPQCVEFGPTVQKGLQYLSDKMINATAPLGDYAHGIATYALAEGYGMTKIPSLKPAMEKGLRMIIDGQQFTGGWDYGYKKGERWDLSVSGWQIQALKAGFIAGADLPDLVPAIEKSIVWLKKETYKDGRFGYSSPGAGSPGMTGAGALCLQLLGEGNSPEAKAAVAWINQNTSVTWDANTKGFVPYGWYYQTQAVFHEAQGWKKWNEQFSKELTRAQKPDGHWETGDSGEYDPYMNTCFCCLMLEVYYRFLPTFKMDLHSKPVVAAPSLDVGETKGLELKAE